MDRTEYVCWQQSGGGLNAGWGSSWGAWGKAHILASEEGGGKIKTACGRTADLGRAADSVIGGLELMENPEVCKNCERARGAR